MSDQRRDLAVIGGGPAGMAAAIAAAERGLDTILFHDQPAPGGQIYRSIEQISRDGRLDALGEEYRRGVDLLSAFRESGAQYAPGSIVWQTAPDGRVGVTDGDGARVIRAERIVLATGALERPVAVPGWTLPGVMGAGAVQSLLKSAAIVPDVPVVIAGSGPLIYLVAIQLAHAGCPIAALLVTTPAGRIAGALKELPRAPLAGRGLAKGVSWMHEVRRLGIPTANSVAGLSIKGTRRAEAVHYQADGKPKLIEAGLVLVHEGVIPNIQLSLSTRCDHVWDEGQECWRLPMMKRSSAAARR
ncbi:MAG: FAD-dependent oxidoreductase [Stellaceae bacterium]